MKLLKLFTTGLAIAVVSPLVATAATTTNSPRSTTYNVGYFSTNHGFLRFHIGRQKFFDSPGTLTIHVGDKVNFTEDAGPPWADVIRITIVKESPSGVIHVTKTTHTVMNLTAQKPGTVIIDFKRCNSSKPGAMVLKVLS